MSEFFLNERSLHGQFSTQGQFLEALRTVISARELIERTGRKLFCDHSIRACPVIGFATFEQCLRDTGRKELIRSVLAWLSKSGPFWGRDQLHSATDIFAFRDDDFAGSSLAEAAVRSSDELRSSLFSFISENWKMTPISVEWSRTDFQKTVDILNFWELQPLETELFNSEKPLSKWGDFTDWARRWCPNLIFRQECIFPLLREPFSYAAADDIKKLLKILNEISESRTEDGALNARGQHLCQLHFQGQHCLFSDETHNEKFNFKHPVTEDTIQCSWHGKIRLGLQYRIHFEWPIPANSELWVSYIGPKLTKW